MTSSTTCVYDSPPSTPRLESLSTDGSVDTSGYLLPVRPADTEQPRALIKEDVRTEEERTHAQVDAIMDVLPQKVSFGFDMRWNDMACVGVAQNRVVGIVTTHIQEMMKNLVVPQSLDYYLAVDSVISLLANKPSTELETIRHLPNFYELLVEYAYGFFVCRLQREKRVVTANDGQIVVFLSGWNSKGRTLPTFVSTFLHEANLSVLNRTSCSNEELEKVVKISNALAQETSINYVGRDDAFIFNNSINAYFAWLHILDEKMEPVKSWMNSLQCVLGIFDWVHHPSNHQAFSERYGRWRMYWLKRKLDC
jgi:hypothetical protein